MEYITHRGERIPLIGLGSWCIGDNEQLRKKEVETFMAAINKHDMTLLDTAEMYGLGKSEKVLADVLKQCDRSKLFLVSKIFPHNATPENFRKSFEATLQRLGTDYLDLYLLHWRQKADLQFVVNEMESLVREGRIRHWGVSNFDVADMEDLFRCEGGERCFANQVLYNVSERGIEFDLIPWMKAHDILPMAYSILGDNEEYRKRIDESEAIREACSTSGMDKFNLLIRFVLRNKEIVSLFKTSSPEHLDSNMQNAFDGISPEIMTILERDFPKPNHKTALNKI